MIRIHIGCESRPSRWSSRKTLICVGSASTDIGIDAVMVVGHNGQVASTAQSKRLIDQFVSEREPNPKISKVRGSFLVGTAAYKGSKAYTLSHLQVTRVGYLFRRKTSIFFFILRKSETGEKVRQLTLVLTALPRSSIGG